MLLVTLLTLASAADLTVSPRLPAVLPCDDGAWSLRFSSAVTVAPLTEGGAPLTCGDITCQPTRAEPPSSVTLSAERAEEAYAALHLDCPDERHLLAIGLLPPRHGGGGHFPLAAGVRWEGGYVSLVEARDGRELRVNGDALLLVQPARR